MSVFRPSSGSSLTSERAAGAVGADDPLLAFEDAIRQFAPDHLLIALRAGAASGWQERGLLDQLHQRFGLPMTAFSVASD